jgi:hypothetical protein
MSTSNDNDQLPEQEKKDEMHELGSEQPKIESESKDEQDNLTNGELFQINNT